jgi:hypothetical protein
MSNGTEDPRLWNRKDRVHDEESDEFGDEDDSIKLHAATTETIVAAERKPSVDGKAQLRDSIDRHGWRF